MTERAPRLLISPLGPNWGRPLQCGLEICTSHLGFSLVDGLGDGGGVGGHRQGVDGVAVGDVEVDEAAGGRVLGRQGVGQHQGGAVDLDLGVADAAPGHGHSDACVQVGLVSASAHLAYASLSALMCRGVDQRYETVGDSLHVFRVGFAGWGQVALGRIYGAYAVQED